MPLKSVVRTITLLIAVPFLFLLGGEVRAGDQPRVQDDLRLSALSAQETTGEGLGILIKGFEFVRPLKPPESKAMAALKSRRRQIVDMASAEKERLEQAPEKTRKNIEAHIEFLEKSLSQVDSDIIREEGPLVPVKTLHEVTEEFRNRELTLEEMNEVANMVTIAYQEKGYILARAYVPEQEIEDGILKVAIIEGDIGEVKITGHKYYKERVIKRNFQHQLQHGVIREELLEKGILLSKELPATETRIVLQKGEKPGTANISLQTEDRLALEWKFDANNFGSELVGKERYGTDLQVTEPWWGSTLGLRAVSGNDKSQSALLGADLSIPTNVNGLSFFFRYVDGLYAVGQDLLVDLGLEGDTMVYGAGLLYPVSRTRNSNLTFSMGYDKKYTRNFLLEEISNIDDLKVYYATLDFDSLDRFLGKNLASLGYYNGTVHPDILFPPSREDPESPFHRYTLNLARIQKVYGNINFIARASGQKTRDRLLPIEQMAIGGYGTVRGHETSLALGDSGLTLSGELITAPPYIADKTLFGQKVSQMAQMAFFFDYGHVRTNKPRIREALSETLSGYGTGIRLYYKDAFSFKFDIAWPTKEETPQEDPRFYYFVGSLNLMSDTIRPKLEKLGSFVKLYK